MHPPRLILPLISLLALACAAPRPIIDLEALRERHELQLAQQAAAERDFQVGLELPMERDLGPMGTLIISNAELAGRLGDEMVRVRATLVNTTGAPLSNIWLVVRVVDPRRELVHSVAEPVALPRGLTFHRGSSYTTLLPLPTQGAHLVPRQGLR